VITPAHRELRNDFRAPLGVKGKVARATHSTRVSPNATSLGHECRPLRGTSQSPSGQEPKLPPLPVAAFPTRGAEGRGPGHSVAEARLRGVTERASQRDRCRCPPYLGLGEPGATQSY